MINRRVKMFRLDTKSFMKLMTTGSSFHIYEGIPVGARLSKVYSSEQYIHLYLEHESFDNIPDSMIAPTLKLSIGEV